MGHDFIDNIELCDVAHWVTRMFMKANRREILTTQMDADGRVLRLCAGTPTDDTHPYVYVMEARDAKGNLLPLIDVVFSMRAARNYSEMVQFFTQGRLPHVSFHRLTPMMRTQTLREQISEQIYTHLTRPVFQQAA